MLVDAGRSRRSLGIKSVRGKVEREVGEVHVLVGNELAELEHHIVQEVRVKGVVLECQLSSKIESYLRRVHQGDEGDE